MLVRILVEVNQNRIALVDDYHARVEYVMWNPCHGVVERQLDRE